MKWRTAHPAGTIYIGDPQEAIDACGLLIEGATVTVRDDEAWRRFQDVNPGVALVGCTIVRPS